MILVEMSGERVALLVAVLAGLASSSVFYNRWVDSVTESDPLGGYSALHVVFGVSYTLLGKAALVALLLGGWAALVSVLAAMACFAASGVPMILGDMQRAARRRRAELARREEIAT